MVSAYAVPGNTKPTKSTGLKLYSNVDHMGRDLPVQHIKFPSLKYTWGKAQ